MCLQRAEIVLQAYADASAEHQHFRGHILAWLLQMVLDPLPDSDSAAMGAATLWAVVQVLTPLPASELLPVCAQCIVQHKRNVALSILCTRQICHIYYARLTFILAGECVHCMQGAVIQEVFLYNSPECKPGLRVCRNL